MDMIRIQFSDFPEGFDPDDNIFIRLLRTRFPVEISDHPDYLIYSDGHRRNYRHFEGIRVHFAIEDGKPDFSQCDYSMNFCFTNHPRSLRLPFYFAAVAADDLIRGDDELGDDEVFLNRKFCNFIYSNANRKTGHRSRILDMLNAYRRVDSGGRMRNNLGFQVQDKVAFCRDYKFTLALENKVSPGYTSEKLPQAMASRSVPVYWGNPLVAEDFNPASFINLNDYPTLDEGIAHVMEVDRDDALYRKYFSQPYFHDNQVSEYFSGNRLLDFFDQVFKDNTRYRRKFYSFTKLLGLGPV